MDTGAPFTTTALLTPAWPNPPGANFTSSTPDLILAGVLYPGAIEYVGSTPRWFTIHASCSFRDITVVPGNDTFTFYIFKNGVEYRSVSGKNNQASTKFIPLSFETSLELVTNDRIELRLGGQEANQLGRFSFCNLTVRS